MSGTRVAFEKWEGLGNDFVLVEADAATWSDDQVRAVCDRRRGVGADGVLFVSRGAPAGDAPRGRDWRTPPGAEPPRMVVRNADGSRPEMCGNGIRCVAGYLAARDEAATGGRGADVADAAATGGRRPDVARARPPLGDGVPTLRAAIAGTITIATDAGPKRCEVTGDGGRFEVSVEMGAARIEGELAVEVDGRTHVFTRVDVGNPHAITFEPYDEAAIDRVGPRVATFPAAGTNVELCRVVSGGDVSRVDVVVWERGVGRTLACGTGACAVASAACAAGYFAYGAPVRVRLPGGDLVIAVERGTWQATMRGPARRVFAGELETP